MNFIDKVRIFVKAGDGGDGCLSFWHEKGREFGGPDGADGGRGGDIYLEASTNLTTLLHLARNPHCTSGDGSNGKGVDKTGDSSEDSTFYVPVGTLVHRDHRLIADLCTAGQRIMVARGGRGGRGNLSFKTQKNTAPRLAEKGGPGENIAIELELKLLADVGLIGFPNAGKSSLLARLSAARPKVADYPFTTLSPNLGVAEHKGVSFVLADIPGLIEGAHEGKGLGADFLRHVERTRFLVHMVDPLGFGGNNPLDGIRKIEGELKAFSLKLARKPRILVVNKMDLPEGEETLKKVSGRYRARKPLGISAATGQGLGVLLDRLIQELSRHPAPATTEPITEDQARIHIRAGFKVKPLGGGRYCLIGKPVERAAAMLDTSLPEAVDRFQSWLKRIGVDRALSLAGIQDGDEVICGPFSFEWEKRSYAALPRLRERHRRTRIGVGKN